MLSTKFASLGIQAALYEVGVTPKPGLVDRNNPGAHTDMDHFTFMASASAFSGGLHRIASIADEWRGKRLEDLFFQIRPVGVQMEMDMFRATRGVNTHKGMIFNIGLLVAATSYLFAVNNCRTPTIELIAQVVSEMTHGICSRELGENKTETHGEAAYVKYGTKGIRGEVESGYETVLKMAVPVYRSTMYNNLSLDELGIQMLFSLMASCEDSNIVTRHDLQTLKQVQIQAKGFLDEGGILQQDAMKKVKCLDEAFVEKNISPGGSADLLAVAIYMGLVEGAIN